MESPALFINACVRSDSRTMILADRLLKRLNMPFDELRLGNVDFPLIDEAFLKKRDRLIAECEFDDPSFELARRFARAECIVIAAPYWDLSFPAALKQYFEQVNVVGISFKYSADGVPVGLCSAKRLFYVTTAGGAFAPEEFGFGYVKALAQAFYGIEDVRLIKATGLDIAGADVGAILRSAEAEIAAMKLD